MLSLVGATFVAVVAVVTGMIRRYSVQNIASSAVGSAIVFAVVGMPETGDYVIKVLAAATGACLSGIAVERERLKRHQLKE